MSASLSERPTYGYTIGSGPTEGYRLNVSVAAGREALALYRLGGYFRFLISPSSPVELQTGNQRRLLAAPCLIWSWEGQVPIVQTNPDDLKLIAFHPDIVNCRFTYELLRQPDGLSVTESQDLYFLEPFLKATNQQPAYYEYAFAEVQHFQKLYDSICQILGQHNFEGWPCQCRATVIELMFSLRRLTDRVLPISLNATLDELAEKVAFAVQSRLSQRLSVAELAREFATNRTSLAEHFQAAFGCGVIEFQRSARLRAAQAMLKDTFLPIDSIMERIGYHDASAFSRAFKNSVGCSPSEYRAQHNWML